MTPWLSTHSAPACGGWQRNWIHRGAPRPANPVTCFPTGKVVAPATKGGNLPRPQGGCKGFSRQRRHKKWRPKGRRTSPAQRCYITPEGESPQPACKAKPITGRTLGAQGQRPGGAINPHARKGVSTFGNTGKHRPGHGPDPYPSSLPSRIFSTRVWYLSSVDRWPTLMTVILGMEVRRL